MALEDLGTLAHSAALPSGQAMVWEECLRLMELVLINESRQVASGLASVQSMRRESYLFRLRGSDKEGIKASLRSAPFDQKTLLDQASAERFMDQAKDSAFVSFQKVSMSALARLGSGAPVASRPSREAVA